MGCKWIKTGAVFPANTIQPEQQSLDNVERTKQNKHVVFETSPTIVESKHIQNIKSRQSSSKSNGFLRQSPSKNQSPSNGVERMPTRQTSSIRSIPAGTPKPNVNEEIAPRLGSAGSNTEVQRRKTNRAVVADVIVSKNTEETVLNDSYGESQISDFHYDDIVSSSSSRIGTEKTTLLHDTLTRFSSALPQEDKTRQGTFFDGISYGSDESYPLHDSIVTSTSSDMEISNVQENIPPREIVNQSDETDSFFGDIPTAISSGSKKMMVNRGVRSSPLKKSDSVQQKIVYETSSNCSEC